MQNKVLTLLILTAQLTWANHNRGGYINYYHVSGNQYVFRIYTWTDPSLPASDRCEMNLYVDNMDTLLCTRVNGAGPCPNGGTGVDGVVILPGSGGYGGVKENIYESPIYTLNAGTHYFTVIDPNRKPGVINIGGSGSQNLAFAIIDTFFVSATSSPVVYNNSPVISYRPIDYTSAGNLFTYNPGMIDPDNDSLDYSLIRSYEDDPNNPPIGLQQITTETIPAGLTIDNLTGTLTWSPVTSVQGDYDISILIKEYKTDNNNCRKVLVGTTVLDIPLRVQPGSGTSITFSSAPQNVCVLAHATYTAQVAATGTGIGSPPVSVTAMGLPITSTVVGTNATFTATTGNSSALGTFSWPVAYAAVHENPYPVIIRASDANLPDHATYQCWFLKVVSPPPSNLSSSQVGNSTQLTWNPPANYSGNTIYQFSIYRADSCVTFNPSLCQPGPPPGCTFLGATFSSNGNNSWTDTNVPPGTHQYFVAPWYLYCSRGQAAASSCLVTGVDDISTTDFSVFPNPSSGKFTVRLNSGESSVKITLSNLLGQAVNCPADMQNGEAKLDLSGYGKGIYFLTLKSKSGELTKKILVE